MQHGNSSLEISIISENQVYQSFLMLSGTSLFHNNFRRLNSWIISLGFKMKGCIKPKRSKILLYTDRIRLCVNFTATSSDKEQSNLKQLLSAFHVIPRMLCKYASCLDFNVLTSNKSFSGIISFSVPQMVKNLVKRYPRNAKSGKNL